MLSKIFCKSFGNLPMPTLPSISSLYVNKLSIILYIYNIMSNLDSFKNNFKHFIVNNNVIGTTAGVCIGLVTKDFISSLVADIIIPLIVLSLKKIQINYITKILPIKTSLNITLFINNFTTWIILIVISYLFIQYAFIQLLDIKNTDKTDKNK